MAVIIVRNLSAEEVAEMWAERKRRGCPNWETYLRALRAVYKSVPKVQDSR
jgi:hypothetical protein